MFIPPFIDFDLMLFLIVFLCAILVAAGLGLLSGLSDLNGMIIPNMYSVGIVVAFAFAYAACALSGVAGPFQPLPSHLWAGGVALAVTFVMTMTKTMGGGDSKLITAYALWMGVLNVAWFLFVVTLAGAVLAMIAIAIRRFKPFKDMKAGTWIARSQAGEAVVPYGIPIVAGALYMFVARHYVSLDILKAFVAPTE